MTQTKFLDLPLDQLHEDNANVRTNLVGIDELAEEVARDGILQPILVRSHPDRAGHYQIVAGHRRFAAAKKAGLTTMPAVVRVIDDNEKTALQLVENVQRMDLSAIEIAHGLKALLEHCDGDMVEAAKRVGQTSNWANKHLALLKLDPKVTKAIQRAKLGIAAAREVYSLARAGKLDEAVTAAQSLAEGKVSRDVVAKRNRELRSGESSKPLESEVVTAADRIFERKGAGYSVLVTVDPRIALDEHAERRIDAILSNFDKFLGTAA